MIFRAGLLPQTIPCPNLTSLNNSSVQTDFHDDFELRIPSRPAYLRHNYDGKSWNSNRDAMHASKSLTNGRFKLHLERCRSMHLSVSSRAYTPGRVAPPRARFLRRTRRRPVMVTALEISPDKLRKGCLTLLPRII